LFKIIGPALKRKLREKNSMYFVGLCESEKHREIDKKDRQKMKKERET